MLDFLKALGIMIVRHKEEVTPRPLRSIPSRGLVGSHGTFPLVLGVTGHRDLRVDDAPVLKQRVLEILGTLRQRYPSTHLVLLSSLAEGAERLVASAALLQDAKLVVPLPMPLEEYERDFDDVSRRNFRELLDRSEIDFTLPLLRPLEEIHRGGDARDLQYEQAGAYLAQQCQILIALWDGRQTDRVGSTSRIVNFQLHGMPKPSAPPRAAPDQPVTGLVYHVVTPRQRSPVPLGSPFAVHLLTPDDMHKAAGGEVDGHNRTTGNHEHGVDPRLVPPRQYDHLFGDVDRFNRDSSQLGPRLQYEREESRRAFPPAVEAGEGANVYERNVDSCVTAEVLAIFLGRSLRGRPIILGLVATGTACVYLHTYEMVKHANVPFLAEAALVVAVLATVVLLLALAFWAGNLEGGDVQDRYLDYRALAEGLRVQAFWRLAEIADCVADHYLESELDWIRCAIRTVDILRAPRSSDPNLVDTASRLKLVLRFWAEEERNWYERRAGRERRWTKIGQAFFGVDVAASFVIACVAAMKILANDVSGGGFLALSTVPLAIAALFQGISQRVAYNQFRQYHRMSQLLQRAVQVLHEDIEQQRYDDASADIRELGREMLTEHGNWVALRRAHPVVLPPDPEAI